MARQYKNPLVVHLRPKKDSASMTKLVDEAVEMMQGVLDKQHPVYLHCFMAGMDEYFTIVKTFPKSVFGITLKTLRHPAGEDLVRRMELSRMMLETV